MMIVSFLDMRILHKNMFYCDIRAFIYPYNKMLEMKNILLYFSISQPVTCVWVCDKMYVADDKFEWKWKYFKVDQTWVNSAN